MIKKISILFPICLALLLLMWTGTYSQSKKTTAPDQKKVDSPSKESADSTFDFDSLLVIHFHPTAQCSCCINVGNFSKRGLERFYSKPYENGRILFRECNIDKDSLIARRYKIFGSALGFKKLLKGKEEFKEIESVWEFCEDEGKFLINFHKELDRFIDGREIEVKEKTE